MPIRPAVLVYNEQSRFLPPPGDPPFEIRSNLKAHWGRVWGIKIMWPHALGLCTVPGMYVVIRKRLKARSFAT